VQEQRRPVMLDNEMIYTEGISSGKKVTMSP